MSHGRRSALAAIACLALGAVAAHSQASAATEPVIVKSVNTVRQSSGAATLTVTTAGTVPTASVRIDVGSTAVGPDTSAPYVLTVPASVMNRSDGTWGATLRIRATDTNGWTTTRTYRVGSPPAAERSAPIWFEGRPLDTGAVRAVWTKTTTSGVVPARYRLRRGTTTVTTTTNLRRDLTGITCGTTVDLAVDALDAAGAVLGTTTVSALAPPCAPAPGDTTPPAAPTGLQVTSRAADGVTVGWTAATDNVGVTGYAVTFGTDAARTVTGTTASVSGKACGTDIPVSVVALDAAGNRSTAASITARTADCTTPSGAQVYLSPNGSDSAACTATAPCRTLPRGYQAARAGDVVEMAGGTYPGGTIAYDSAKASGAVVLMRPAAGASVTVSGELHINASSLEIRGITAAGGWQTHTTSNGVTIRDVDAKHLFISSSQNVKVLGGSVGPGLDYHPIIQAENSTPPRNILVDGVTFHDWTVSNTSIHSECLQIGSGDGITIRNSRFINCHGTGNLHITHWGTAPTTRNVTVENNFFSATVNGYYAIQANTYPNLLIRNNSSLQGFLLFPWGGVENVRMVANVAPMSAWECVSGVIYRDNVWTAATCDPSDTTGALRFVNPATLDLHLLSDSPAIGNGNATLGTTTDIDGQARPQGGAPDAGADER